MQKLLNYFVSAVLLCCSMGAWAVSSPVSMLEKVSAELIDQLEAKQGQMKQNPQAAVNLVNEVLMPHVDMDVVSYAVLGKQWQSATAQEKSEFKKRFTTILIMTYVKALTSYTNETVKFMPLKEDYNTAKRLRVDSRILRQQAPPIPVSYRVIRRDDTWKIYDLIVEQVSLVQNYRSQFSSVLRQGGGMQALLKTLEKHNAKF
jgi:phospholipid transport system substrate-binding protein